MKKTEEYSVKKKNGNPGQEIEGRFPDRIPAETSAAHIGMLRPGQ
ncbi:MAG TPA: hypothetical protein VEC06_08855 [Paucimonas sp.]|nr:hypothetical protein [Paucimonas sp.]